MASDSNGNQWYQQEAGLGSVASYQVSGVPWVTSSLAVPPSTSGVASLSFPQVTKFVTIKNETSNLVKVAFSENGLLYSNNFFVLGDKETINLDVRVSKLFFRGSSSASSLTVVAGLTSIKSSNLLNNWSGSSGIG